MIELTLENLIKHKAIESIVNELIWISTSYRGYFIEKDVEIYWGGDNSGEKVMWKCDILWLSSSRNPKEIKINLSIPHLSNCMIGPKLYYLGFNTDITAKRLI